MNIVGAPSANNDIANQSKVVQSPAEQQAAYDAWQQQQLAQTNRMQGYYDNYANADKSYNDLANALALSGAAPKGYVSSNVAPGIAQGDGVTDSLNGKTIDRSALYWAHDMAAQIRSQALAGQPIDTSQILDRIGGNNPAVAEALKSYTTSVSQFPQVNALGYGPDSQIPGASPYASHTMNMIDFNSLGQKIGDLRNLGTQGVNSFNQNALDQYNNKNSNGQAYLNMLGGGYAGGINPWSINPSWSGSSAPQWQAPQFASQQQLQGQAAQSPWGTAGAPFVQQLFAGGGGLNQGAFNPTLSNPFDPNGAVAPDPQPQQPWFSGTFNPNSYSPQLASQSPWGGPFQNTGNNGAPPTFGMPGFTGASTGFNAQTSQPTYSSPVQQTPTATTPAPQAGGFSSQPPAQQQQNPMTFGQSPWGSSWG